MVQKWDGVMISTYEDLGMEGEGIVATLSCTNCNASSDFYSNEDDK